MRSSALPLAVFCALIAVLGIGLTLEPRKIPSPLVGKPLPEFTLPQLASPDTSLSPEDLRGKPWLLNVWASWCVACRQEHPLLVDLARTSSVPVYGLNYKDDQGQARAWLTRFGDPYRASAVDRQGLVGIDLGVYGVPETFVIDKDGVVRHKQIGPITPEVLRETILPLMRKLGA